MPKVTVIIPVYNYGKYVKQAIDSVICQHFEDYEIVVVNDCSTDTSAEVLQEYINHPKIRIINNQENLGFVRSCRKAIENARGEYIIRLDADDYMEENALHIMSNILDLKPEVGLVYADYITVSAEDRIIDYVRLPRSGIEDKIHDIPANGAMTMFRHSCYNEVGGYDPSIDCQDGYDLWLKFLKHYQFYNINLPLFYYRRHGANFGEDSERILKARRYVKKRQVADEEIPKPCVLGIITTQLSKQFDHLSLQDLGNKSLMAYTIDEALRTPELDHVVLTTGNADIASSAKSYGIDVVIHPQELAGEAIQHKAIFVLEELERKSIHPDIIIVLNINSPFRKNQHITEAINTMMLFEVDSVISVCQDLKVHFQHGPSGLAPLRDSRGIHLEKENLYEDNGAIYASRKGVITPNGFLGDTIGHIIMTQETSININSEYTFRLAEQVVKYETN